MENYLPLFLTNILEYTIYAKVKILGHREYNTIEILSKEDENGKMLISAIVCLHNGTSLRFINDKDVVADIKQKTPARKAFFSPIELQHYVTKETRRIAAVIYTEKNEEIILNLRAGRVNYHPKKLMSNPTGFISKREIPVGFGFDFRRIQHSSKVEINQREYKLDQDITFLGMSFGSSGRMAEKYLRLNLSVPPERVNCVKKPSEFKEGESWEYISGARKISYEIGEVLEDGLYITRDNARHHVIIEDGKMLLNDITQETIFGENLKVDFTPPVPISYTENEVISDLTVVCSDVCIYSAVIKIAHNSDRTGNVISLVGEKRYHSAEHNICYERTAEGDWIINRIDPSLFKR